MTNIADLQPNEVSFEILHPATDEPLGISVSIMSADDARMKPIIRKITDANLQKQRRGKTLKAIEIENNEKELIASAMTGWDWWGEDINFDGEKPEFTTKNIHRVFNKLPWFMTQINEQIDENKSFFRN